MYNVNLDFYLHINFLFDILALVDETRKSNFALANETRKSNFVLIINLW